MWKKIPVVPLIAVVVLGGLGYGLYRAIHDMGEAVVGLGESVREMVNAPDSVRVAMNTAFAPLQPDSLTLDEQWTRYVAMEHALMRLGGPEMWPSRKPVTWGDPLLNVTREQAMDRRVTLVRAMTSGLRQRLAMPFAQRTAISDAPWTNYAGKLYDRLDVVVLGWCSIVGVYQPDAYEALLPALIEEADAIDSVAAAGNLTQARALAADFLLCTRGSKDRSPVVQAGDVPQGVIDKIARQYGQPPT